ncbi:hypothetical protein BJ912DRAFT_1090718 [Pholiota molesta]|nr:hypothetical protein BJ912DRAFT_1090718 [Pholiota molesta]
MSTSIGSSGGGGAAFSPNHSASAHPHHYIHPQHRHGGTKGGSSGSAKSMGSAAAISLVISPNLDALLKHDSEERERSARPRSPESTHSGAGSAQLLQLSPPRAGAGEGGAAVGWGKDEEEGEPTGLPPPPRKTGRGAGLRSPQTGRSPHRATGAVAESPRRTPEREDGEAERREGVVSANPYINRAPTLEDVLVGRRRASLEETGTGRSRDAGQSWLQMGRRIPVAVDPRTPAMTSDPGQRQRALLSHAPHPSVSSIDSAGSTAPASTAEHEPRISISSTIYAASSTHSLPHSLYNQPNSARDSFIDLYSPLRTNFHNDAPGDSGPTSPIQFADPPPDDRARTKPPLPTTPKPVFDRRSRSRSPMPNRTPPPPGPAAAQRPPTTNFLDIDERADLIRKTRKLARVFGETPGADAMAQQDANRVLAQNPLSRARAALSLVDNTSLPRGSRRTPADVAYFAAASPRRHSMPLTPDDVSFLSIVSPNFDNAAFPRTQVAPPARAESPVSFIDISDDESLRLRSRASMQSIMTLSSDDLAEEERRRKRERLAKLHRFLGSRVPAHLVLGFDPVDTSLPPRQLSSESSGGDESSGTRKTWLKRRRSSSAVILPSEFRPDELERVKEELDDKEKAINVRRAHKMEKVFGVAPPQTLYHTRHCNISRPRSAGDPAASSGPSSAGSSTPSSMLGALPSLTTNRTASYLPKVRSKKKSARPSTAESSKQLIPKDGEDGEKERGQSRLLRRIRGTRRPRLARGAARVPQQHRHPHAHPHGPPTTTTTAKADPADPGTGSSNVDLLSGAVERRLSLAPSIKSERRRSLPARTSLSSLAPSEFTVAPDAAEFQQRRRRAAKLTQFFGVNYRELIADVLESIEHGVAHEGARGTLRAEEIEDLLKRLRTLKTKRTSLFS